jgi:hypothetical protein
MFSYPLTQTHAKLRSLQGDSSYFLCAILAIVTVAFLAANLGKFLNYVFPLFTVSTGLYLYSRNPVFYVSFTWWVWFLSPLIRRLADYRGGAFSEQSLILLTPYLVTLISAMTLAKTLKYRRLEESLPFLVCLLSLVYGYTIGVLNLPVFKPSLALLNWAVPIIFGYHLLASWRNYVEYAKSIRKVFFWCLIIAGSYGLYQYLVAPAWDCAWLISVDGGAGGFGQPAPQKIRVWSIMQGPGVFATVMAVALLLSSTKLNVITALPSVIGYLSLLLTSVRSAWIAWIIGFFVIVVRLRSRDQANLLISGAIVTALIIPLSGMEQFSELITTRFQSFSSLSSDGSSQVRLMIYENAMSFVTTNFVGMGLGGNDVGFDSGFLEVLVSLGWIGSIPYLFGLFLILHRLLRLNISSHIDSFAIASRAIAIAIIFQMPFGSSMIGLPGVILWSFSALSFASIRYEIFSKLHSDNTN